MFNGDVIGLGQAVPSPQVFHQSRGMMKSINVMIVSHARHLLYHLIGFMDSLTPLLVVTLVMWVSTVVDEKGEVVLAL